MLHNNSPHCVYTSLRHSQPTSFTVSHSTSPDRTTLYQLSTFGRRVFSVAGPTVWNSLPDSLRDLALTSNSFRQSLKTNLFRRYHSAHSAVEMLHDSALYKSIIDIDIIDYTTPCLGYYALRRNEVVLFSRECVCLLFFRFY